MKEKIITLLFCILLSAAMISVSCDNGDPPNLDADDKEYEFIQDYGAVKEDPKDIFDSELETEIGKM